MRCQKPSTKFLRLSPRWNSSDFINMYRQTLRLAKSAYYWGLELGLRIGEICGLQWGDFDLKLGTLNINRTVCRISCGNGHTKVVIQTSKTRTSRREIPLTKQLLIMPKSCAEAPEMLHGSFPAASPSPPNPAATGKASKEITLISPLLKWKIPPLVFLFFCRRVHNCFILC